MYKIVMIIAIIVVGTGWLIYGIYWYIVGQREKKQPKRRSERYRQAQSSMKEYAEKLAKFKRKRYDRNE